MRWDLIIIEKNQNSGNNAKIKSKEVQLKATAERWMALTVHEKE